MTPGVVIGISVKTRRPFDPITVTLRRLSASGRSLTGGDTSS